MRLGLASIFLLAVGGVDSQCQEVTEGNFVYYCCGISKVPVACIDGNNQRMNCGTSRNVFQSGSNLGFTYSCTKPTDLTIEYKPTACVSSDGQSAPIGGTLIQGSFHYLCTQDQNGNIASKLNGCANNGQIVHVGSTENYCSSSGCNLMKCVQTENNGVSLHSVGCRGFNGETLHIGQTIIQNPGQAMTFQYTCQQNGDSTILKPTECVGNGHVVSIGSSVVIGNYEYQCTFDNNVIAFRPQKCLTSNGQLVSSGSEVQIFSKGNLGFTYKCEVSGNSIAFKITGCAANGQTVYPGSSFNVDGVSYICSQNGDVVRYDSQGCWNNNQVVHIGDNCQVCVSTQCSTMKCVPGPDNKPTLQPVGCQAPDGQTVGVGATATVYTNQGSGYTCKCEEQGGAPKLVITGCATANGAVGIGKSTTFGGGNYLCNAEGQLKPQGCINNNQVVPLGQNCNHCVPNQNQCFSMQCTTGPQEKPILKPLSCIAPNNQPVSIGSTVQIFSPNTDLGFLYSCEQPGPQHIVFRPTACLTRSGQSASLGQTLVHGNFRYNCVGLPNNSVDFKIQECVFNGQTIPVGTTQKFCNGGQCQTVGCSRKSTNEVQFQHVGCTFGTQQVNVGGQCIWQQQRCFCTENPRCVPHF